MKLVPLYNSTLTVMVDDEDYDKVINRTWRVFGRKDYQYATTTIPKTGRNLTMHRFIMSAEKGQIIDHINHNPIDNRKENLRVCDFIENVWNRKLPVNNTTGFYGVSYDKRKNKFACGIKIGGKRKFLGFYKVAEDAARAYDDVARVLRGEFANLNFPI